MQCNAMMHRWSRDVESNVLLYSTTSCHHCSCHKNCCCFHYHRSCWSGILDCLLQIQFAAHPSSAICSASSHPQRSFHNQLLVQPCASGLVCPCHILPAHSRKACFDCQSRTNSLFFLPLVLFTQQEKTPKRDAGQAMAAACVCLDQRVRATVLFI